MIIITTTKELINIRDQKLCSSKNETENLEKMVIMVTIGLGIQRMHLNQGPFAHLSWMEAFVRTCARSVSLQTDPRPGLQCALSCVVQMSPRPRSPSPSDGLLMRGLDAQSGATHRDHDAVVSLEFGEEQISAYHLRLVERAKATQHFYVALSWDVGHCADSGRRKDAASVGRRDAAEGGKSRLNARSK